MSQSVGSKPVVRGLVAAVVAMVVSGSAVIADGAQRPQFRATVDVVQLQVAVADSRGDHIPNLSSDDFVLRVDGRLRDLTAVYEVDLRQIRGDEFEDEQYIPPAGWRQFLLFFDFSFSTKRGILRARDAAIDFVEKRTHPKDLISVATYTTVGGLKLISPFTADRAQVSSAIRGFGVDRAKYLVDPAGFAVQPLADLLALQEAAPQTAPGGQQDQLQQIIEGTLFATNVDAASQDFRRYREEVVNYADQLVGLGDMLTATRGRKHVLLFSAGFDDKVLAGQSLDELAEDTERLQQGMSWAINSETRFGSADLRESLSKAVANLNASDTVFHAFDVGGLGNDRVDDTFRTTQSGKQGLAYLAEGTNGTITWNANDLTPALATLAEETARYYVLAYPKNADDDTVVELGVEVRRPGAQILAAPERFSPPPAYADMDETQQQLQLSEFISKGIEEEDMTFDVRATAFAGDRRISRLAVVVEIPFGQIEAIAESRGDGATEFDILGYVTDAQGQMRDMFSRRVRLTMQQLSGRMDGLPFRYYDLLWALPGPQQVRVLVRDVQAGQLSTRTEIVEVPGFENPTGVVVSGPVAVDAAHPGLLMRGIDPSAPPQHRAGGPVAYPFVVGDQEVTPQVYTLTEAGGRCQFLIVAHNLARHPFTGQVQTSLNATAIDERGASHEIAAMNLVARYYDAEQNATSMLVEAVLPDSLGEGAYLLEIDLVDAIAGQTVEQVMPFLISADAGID